MEVSCTTCAPSYSSTQNIQISSERSALDGLCFHRFATLATFCAGLDFDAVARIWDNILRGIEYIKMTQREHGAIIDMLLKNDTLSEEIMERGLAVKFGLPLQSPEAVNRLEKDLAEKMVTLQ